MVELTVVTDASVAAKWFLKEEDWEAAEALLKSAISLIAPELVLAEVLNAYWKHVQKGDKPAISIEDVVDLLGQSFDRLIPIAELASTAAEIAIDLRHPIYDCFYLALATAEKCEMVTADDRLYRKTRRTRFAKVVRKLA